MALINKTGITNGGTIQAEHITRAIDALSGGSTDSVSITGSLMGSSSYAATASLATTAYLIQTGSIDINFASKDGFIYAQETVPGNEAELYIRINGTVYMIPMTS